MTDESFSDKFIAYIDILGFKNLVDIAASGVGLSVGDLKEFCVALGTSEDRAEIARYGSTICPKSCHVRRDLDFQITQASDGVVLSAEVSPAGVINLVNHCWQVAMRLLSKGIMVRGYVTRGPIFHDGHIFMGAGYHRALDGERGVTAFKLEADERGTPFIELDPAVSDYVGNCGDECVKEMFSRMVAGDETVAAIFPFKRLSYSVNVGGFGQKFDLAKEKEFNQIIRDRIGSFKERIRRFADASNPYAIKKARHYLRLLDEQLDACDKTDEMIDWLCTSLPAKRMRVI